MLGPLSALVNLIFPPVCALCGGDAQSSEDGHHSSMVWRGHGICHRCKEELSWLSPPFCPRCAMPIRSAVASSHLCGECLEDPPPFHSAHALMVYGEEVFPLLHRMKYGPDASLARFMGVLLARHLSPQLAELDLAGVVPIPLHPARLRHRGFNQASTMGRELARSLGVDLELELLVRVRATPPQVGLSRAQRVTNVKGAFQVQYGTRAVGRNWLLLDDVYTTGATLREAARVLLRAGARQVHVVTFARVL